MALLWSARHEFPTAIDITLRRSVERGKWFSIAFLNQLIAPTRSGGREISIAQDLLSGFSIALLIQSRDPTESRPGGRSYSTSIVTIFKHQIVSKYAKI